MGVYSSSDVAARKRAIDLKIADGDLTNDGTIEMKSEDYLKQLIELASKGTIEVSTKARSLQFFIIVGGAEGFLDRSYKNKDASNMVEGGDTTDGTVGTSMRFSDTDLLVAFDAHGDLVSSALLRRPIWIKNPNIWSEHSATKIYEAWDGAPVSIYRNDNPDWDIHYYGLWMNDKRGYYASRKIRVDLHKKEATNGCIFIVDDSTPPYVPGNAAAITTLTNFEPQFIQDVQKNIHAKVKSNIGIMRMVEIQ